MIKSKIRTVVHFFPCVLGLPVAMIAGESGRVVAGESEHRATPDANEVEGGISYRISIAPARDRTDLHVVMRFVGDASGVTLLQLPADRYGTPSIWDSISRLHASGAEIRPVAGQASQRRLIHPPSAKVAVEYTMSWDPTLHTGEAYRPSVSETHFHFFGPQWRCRLLDRQGVEEFAFSFENVPEGWAVFSNLGHGPGPYRLKSTDDDLSGFIAGGDYHSELFRIGDSLVGAYVRPPFQNPKAIVASIRDIITQQGKLFGGFNREFFVVSLSPRPRISAGVAIDNAFVMFTDPKKTRVDLETLIAHEALHNWLSKTARIEGWEDVSSLDHFRFDWFMEGFTEYLARRMLLDSGKYRMQDFVDRFNKDLREQARNPMRSASLDVIHEAMKSDDFGFWHERTSYFRGPLIALAWDTQLRRNGTHTLFDVVRQFIEKASASGGALGEEEFFRLHETFGIDARAAYAQHIVNGNPPAPPSNAFGAGYLLESGRNDHGAGFDIDASRSDRIILSVVRDGPAYRAGLRNAMEVLELPPNPAKGSHLKIRVRRDGIEHEFEFPRGVVKEMPDRFEKTPGN